MGSSAKITSAPPASARAMATRCCSPPDRSPGRLFPLPSRPTLFSTALVCAFVIGRPARRAGSETFSPALSDGMRLYDWKMKPTWSRRVLDSALRPACTICVPIIWMEPESAASNPDRQYSSVDFPDPLGPTMPTISPDSTRKLTPRSTSATRRLLPRPMLNDFFTSRATIVVLMCSP